MLALAAVVCGFMVKPLHIVPVCAGRGVTARCCATPEPAELSLSQKIITRLNSKIGSLAACTAQWI